MPSVISIVDTYPYPSANPSGLVSETPSGTRSMDFVVNRTGDLGTTSVAWMVREIGSDGASDADFLGGVLPSGILRFGPGEASHTLTVYVADDRLYEDNEPFEVTLSNPTNGATIGAASARALIRSDDQTMSISAVSADKAEGDADVTIYTFLVDRQTDGASSFNADWTVTGTGPNPATADDFVGGVMPSGNVGFRSSQPAKTIEIAVRGDTAFEADEGFTVTLSSTSPSLLFPVASASGTIRNDDAGVVGPVVVAPLPPITANLAGTTAQVVRLYQATLDRVPEPAGVVFYRSLLDSGQDTLATLVDNFTNSPEFLGKYGNANNEQLVELLYRNVLGREGSEGDVDWYEARMAEGSMTRDTVVIGFSQSPENIQLTARDVQFVVDHYGIG